MKPEKFKRRPSPLIAKLQAHGITLSDTFLKKTEALSLKLDSETLARINSICKLLKCSKGKLVRAAILNLLNKVEMVLNEEE